MHQLDNMAANTYSELLPVTGDNDVSQLATHSNTTILLVPPIYSTLAETHGDYSMITEEEQLAGYSAISDTVTSTGHYSTIGSCDDGLYNHTHHGHTAPPPVYSTLAEGETTTGGYSVITETQDTSDGGMVYSAVVRQDGKKTTVKTTAVLDGSHQQQPDTSNEGLVYSAVVVKDGTKTTVKTTFFQLH